MSGPSAELVDGVSVIVRTHAGGEWIGKALQSLVDQTLDPSKFEIVVVVNGPADATSAVIAEFRQKHPDHNFKVVHSPVWGGGPATNVGFGAAGRTYVTIVDDDDWVSPRYLAALFAAAKPNSVVHAFLADVDPDDRDCADFDTYLNRSIAVFAGQKINWLDAAAATSLNAGKLVWTEHARAIGAPNIPRSTDVVFWNSLVATLAVDLRVVSAESGAVYYRLRRSGSISRPENEGWDLGVTARLDAYEILAGFAANGRAEVRELLHQKASMMAQNLRNWLHDHPGEHRRVVEEIQRRKLVDFPWLTLNRDRAREVAIVYKFLPTRDTSSLVSSRRILARGNVVDVVRGSTVRRGSTDYDVLELVRPFIGKTITVDGPMFFGPGRSWRTFARLGIRDLEERDAILVERGESKYTHAYSRAMWPHSHVLASLYKARRPEVFWRAEFSDPLSRDVHDVLRVGKRPSDEFSTEIDQAVLAAGWTIPDGLTGYQWLEFVTFVLADEVLFTNENQRTYMLDQLGDAKLAAQVLAKSVVEHHPTSPANFYQASPIADPFDHEFVNVGYFGAFYPTRGLTEVVEALGNLSPEERAKLKLHVFTGDPQQVETQFAEVGLGDVVVGHPLVPYLDMLSLTTKLDCLLVNDARTLDTRNINPYLPSKISDYAGSGRPVWAIVEPGSVLSTRDVQYRSELGDAAAATAVLAEVIARGPISLD